jgi:hypothetical protein
MWIALVTLAGVLCGAPAAGAAEGGVRAYPGRLNLPQEVQERLMVVGIGPMVVVTDRQGRVDSESLEPQAEFRLRLNRGTYPRLDDHSEYAAVLSYAAQAYALGTGRLSVTVGDLRDAGYLPYDDPALDPKLSVDTDGPALSLSPWDLCAVGSPQWLTFVRGRILSDWHSRGELQPLTPQHYHWAGPRPCSLPRVAAFWTNPLTGAPMKAGPGPGDYELWSPGMSSVGPEDSAGAIPGINVPSRLDFAVAAGMVSPDEAAKTRAAEATPASPAAP